MSGPTGGSWWQVATHNSNWLTTQTKSWMTSSWWHHRHTLGWITCWLHYTLAWLASQLKQPATSIQRNPNLCPSSLTCSTFSNRLVYFFDSCFRRSTHINFESLANHPGGDNYGPSFTTVFVHDCDIILQKFEKWIMLTLLTETNVSRKTTVLYRMLYHRNRTNCDQKRNFGLKIKTKISQMQ